jgi:hypothetical protein
MSTFAGTLKDSPTAADAFHLMDMLDMGYDADAETSPAAHTPDAIVAIPDIYANSALLKRDPAHAYSTFTLDSFAPRRGSYVHYVIS